MFQRGDVSALALSSCCCLLSSSLTSGCRNAFALHEAGEQVRRTEFGHAHAGSAGALRLRLHIRQAPLQKPRVLLEPPQCESCRPFSERAGCNFWQDTVSEGCRLHAWTSRQPAPSIARWVPHSCCFGMSNDDWLHSCMLPGTTVCLCAGCNRISTFKHSCPLPVLRLQASKPALLPVLHAAAIAPTPDVGPFACPFNTSVDGKHYWDSPHWLLAATGGSLSRFTGCRLFCRVSSQQWCLPCRLWQEVDPRRVALTCVHFPEQRTLAADEALDPAPASSEELAHWLAEQLSLLDTGTPVGRSEETQGAPAVAAAAPGFHPQGVDPAWLLISAVQVRHLPLCCSRLGTSGLMRRSVCMTECWTCCYSTWLLPVLVALLAPAVLPASAAVAYRRSPWRPGCRKLLWGTLSTRGKRVLFLSGSCNINGAVYSSWPGSLTLLPPVACQLQLRHCCLLHLYNTLLHALGL